MPSFWDTTEACQFVKAKDQYPEGAHVFNYLCDLLNRLGVKRLLDFGCGKGRLCRIIAPERYIGYDINQDMVDEARSTFPDYEFTTILRKFDADCTLLYTVISMVDDDGLPEMLNLLESRYVIIGEILGRDWANCQRPMIYNRELDETVQAMSDVGYELVSDEPLEHTHYSVWTGKRDNRIHILLFQKTDYYEQIRGDIQNEPRNGYPKW